VWNINPILKKLGLCVLHDKLLKSIDSKGVNCNIVKEWLLQRNTLNPKFWMVKAHANMCLWNIIIEDNVDVAIHLMFELFISTQKFGVLKTLQKVRDKSIIFRLNQLGLAYTMANRMQFKLSWQCKSYNWKLHCNTSWNGYKGKKCARKMFYLRWHKCFGSNFISWF